MHQRKRYNQPIKSQIGGKERKENQREEGSGLRMDAQTEQPRCECRVLKIRCHRNHSATRHPNYVKYTPSFLDIERVDNVCAFYTLDLNTRTTGAGAKGSPVGD